MFNVLAFVYYVHCLKTADQVRSCVCVFPQQRFVVTRVATLYASDREWSSWWWWVGGSVVKVKCIYSVLLSLCDNINSGHCIVVG